ncbi:MAG: iron-containing alcohol dehydrogenase [Fusobacteriaceae bacterium]
MLNFDFKNATEIIFGKNTEERVGELIKKYCGTKVLIHYGGESAKKSGLYAKVLKKLDNEKIDYCELGGVVPNPRLSLVETGIKLCRREAVNFILAVGGGSVIDSAKAIAAGAKYDHMVWDFFVKDACPESAIPIGVILTIPAAGSESSAGTVITNEENFYKRAFGSEHIRPAFAIMNPELTYSLPPYQTAAGVIDMMMHIFERYFTNEKHVDFTDRLCEGALKSIMHNGEKVLENPRDYNYRAEIMWAGTIAHNDILGTGRSGDWATHDIEHELSAIYDITHGAGLAIISPAWMKYVYKNNISRFVQFATRVFDVDNDISNPDKVILEGIARLEKFIKKMGMPVRLSEANISADRFDEMAEKAVLKGPVGNFIKLFKDDIVKIYELAK